MLAKLLNLLEPLKNLKSKATVLRLGLAGIVLGVGGFAVYKGVQQMKPSRPAPKRTETAANQLQQAGKNAGGASAQVQVASGELPVGEPTAESLYTAGAEQNPASAGDGSLYRVGDQGAGGENPAEVAEGVPASPLNEPYQQPEDGATESGVASVPPNRIRNLPPAPRGRQIGDLGAESMTPEQPTGEGPAAEAYSEGGGAYAGVGDDGSSGGQAGDETIPMEQGGYGSEAGSPDAVSADDGSHLAAPRSLPGVTARQGQNYQARNGLPDATARRNVEDGLSPLETQGSSVGTPGDRQFEGTQVPSVAIEKFAPAEIQVGRSATFEIRVRNAGQVPAHEVIVTDQVPQGTRLEATNPQAQRAADGSLVWQIGDMQPGDEMVLSMQVLPEQEGEIGSVAHVTFAGRATARSVCTRPLLAIEHTAPKQVLIGEAVRLSITISNPGTGAATGVIVEEDVPEGLTHVAGSELEYEIGTLRPGETRQLELQLTADKAGLIENLVTVRGEGNLIAQHKAQIEVIAPQLEVVVNGPKIRYLQRQATYTLSIENPGTAAARSVQLVAFLPKGMKFQSTDAEGQYDPTQHAVFWSLEELPANKSGSVNLVAVPIEPGEQRLRVEGKADLGLTAQQEQIVQVEAKSELVFDIVDLNDPIEVGTETVYEIRVSNNGTRPATGVEVVAGFPERGELKPVSADGHSRGEVRGQQVSFEPVGRINPGEEVTFRVHAQGMAKGDHVIAVQIRSAEFPQAVTREESTRVYDDQ